MDTGSGSEASLRVAIIGTGLIGASWGLALGRLDDVAPVAGHDRDPAALAAAVEVGAVAQPASSAAEAVADADIVVIAVPASAVPAAAAAVADRLRPGAIVTDVSSVKTPTVTALQAAAPPSVHVIGGHPMAGSTETGAAHASADLFVGATYLLTPTTHTDAAAYQRLHALIGRLGARVLAVSPERHDVLVALVSHLPQLAATTLMNLAAERARSEHAGLLLLTAGGFRDATRVAASDPELWLDICAENRDAIIEVLDDYGERIAALRSVLAVHDDQRLRRALAEASTARRDLPGKAAVPGELVELWLVIPDRPGVLADVTTTMGAHGINIEDLGIEHAPVGGQGRLRMAVAGRAVAHEAAQALAERGYEVQEHPQ